ncbi:hypothetical protein SAMN05216255_1632 [Pseudomonas segetis]|uniref:Uncharacterized protein n=1 Tax=Pseudomonas segetis TaxID=298908 RepID=A0A239CEW2_9PSED|nr:hypothetical protein SAMN05216255_1632 [Pseudomonas segetis]
MCQQRAVAKYKGLSHGLSILACLKCSGFCSRARQATYNGKSIASRLPSNRASTD